MARRKGEKRWRESRETEAKKLDCAYATWKTKCFAGITCFGGFLCKVGNYLCGTFELKHKH